MKQIGYFSLLIVLLVSFQVTAFAHDDHDHDVLEALAPLAEQLSMTEQELYDVLSTAPDLETAAEQLGMTAEELGHELEHAFEDSEATPTDTAAEVAMQTGEGLNLSLFYEGALAEEATIVDCTLSNGTETTCYEITIAGYPADYDVGPFCPETTSTSAEDAGIWFDGNGIYDVDGDFILGLAELYNDSNWRLYNDDGTVNITDTIEAFEAAARPDVDPAYQNHCVAGRMEWLENGDPVQTTVMIPTTPVAADSPNYANGNRGITLNGVIIANSAPVDAILSAYTIAVFDDCGGHINPFDGYHLHGAVGCSEVGEAVDDETPIFAYALDGYAIHSPLDEAYADIIELDECGGHYTEENGYHYHANSAEENAVLSCFMGLTVQAGEQGDHNDDVPQGGQTNFTAAAETLGVTEDELIAALGEPGQGRLDFATAATTLGVTEDELIAALGVAGGGPGGQRPEGGPGGQRPGGEGGQPPAGGRGGQG